MAFGQPSGPPANAKQVRELLELLEAAGHADFRDARGPMGFTQRQAGGKFTRDEAEAFIDQLRAEQDERDSAPAVTAEPEPVSPAAPRRQATPRPKASARPAPTPKALLDATDEQLAAELQRRGWVVMEP